MAMSAARARGGALLAKRHSHDAIILRILTGEMRESSHNAQRHHSLGAGTPAL
jgi:hypothetical protein